MNLLPVVEDLVGLRAMSPEHKSWGSRSSEVNVPSLPWDIYPLWGSEDPPAEIVAIGFLPLVRYVTYLEPLLNNRPSGGHEDSGIVFLFYELQALSLNQES